MQIEPDLHEWDYGDYEGRTSTEISRDRPYWVLFREGCPNGETPEAISNRADKLIEKLRSLYGNIALFSHGQFGAVLAARWIGLPVIEAQHLSLATASISILGFDQDHPTIPVIEQWNIKTSKSDHTPTRHSFSAKSDQLNHGDLVKEVQDDGLQNLTQFNEVQR
jgi:probable phosphoglycerate mutase